ncbi:MAG: nucleotidyltransferase domain-containing protein [Clostridiales bacterium]|jgi:predicted nucleotidyltransferase|nr:nucleotidyltransferase domain-containing protein [Clostridiales bacterium]
MAVDYEAANKTVKSYVADVKSAMPIDYAYLYGSYAKGTATEHSDIDICFFSRSFENLTSVEIMSKLFRLTRKYKGIDIEPHGFPTSDLTNDNPFVKEILRTGREII